MNLNYGHLLETTHVNWFFAFALKVRVPIGPLLALAMRILRVDGSRLAVPPPHGATVSSVHQVSLCLEIPALHLNALDLLIALLCGVRRYNQLVSVKNANSPRLHLGYSFSIFRSFLTAFFQMWSLDAATSNSMHLRCDFEILQSSVTLRR